MSAAPEEWLDEIAHRLRAQIEAGAAAQGEETTGRELLSRFGFARRGRLIVAKIRRELETRKLLTSPDFEFEWVDNPICIILDDDAGGTAGARPPVVDPTVRIDVLSAAHNIPLSVKRDDPLVKATTMMRIEDYSQLPVMPNEHTVNGVVSWNSIGEAHAQGRTPTRVGECMVEARVIDISTPLADATDLIYVHDYVLVRKQGKVTGIITAADLAIQFKQLTHPFLLIGEIEHHLRNLVRGRFSVEELVDASGGDDAVRGPDDLTFGGYIRLLQPEEAWTRLGLEADRSVFLGRLETVRLIRNDVMHFSPDARDALETRQLESMAQFCRTLTPYE